MLLFYLQFNVFLQLQMVCTIYLHYIVLAEQNYFQRN